MPARLKPEISGIVAAASAHDYKNFATGFWDRGETSARVWGRPASLAAAADGSLLIADDVGHVVWRVHHAPD